MTDKELRELDAWIDDYVMGWTPKFHVMKLGLFYRPPQNGYTPNPVEAACYIKAKAETLICKGEPSMKIVPVERPKYSTDRAAAMTVLEKCSEKLAGKCELSVKRSDSKRFPKATDIWGFGASIGGSFYAKSLPIAICLYAKKLFSK